MTQQEIKEKIKDLKLVRRQILKMPITYKRRYKMADRRTAEIERLEKLLK